MEKIILEVIEEHLWDNAVIGPSQHGFMRGRSCSTNLISFYDKTIYLVDQPKPAYVIFLDFSKDLTQFPIGSYWKKCPAYN